MKIHFSKQTERGLTLIEVLVILCVAAVLFVLFAPGSHAGKGRVLRIQCVNNLKEIGFADGAWEVDHGNKFPVNVPGTNGGTMEFASGPNAFRHFQVISNELLTPKLLFCPAETDRLRKVATNFTAFNNSNLSYFVGLNISETDPQGIWAGDRNITNGTPIKNGVLELITNQPAGWTKELHDQVGNIALTDGSVQQLSGTGLRAAANTTNSINRLLMPILGP